MLRPNGKAWCLASSKLRNYIIATSCALLYLYYNSSPYKASGLFKQALSSEKEKTQNRVGQAKEFVKPTLKPNHKYSRKPEVPKCPNHDRALIDSNKTHIWLNASNYKHYAVVEKDVRCCYKEFYSIGHDRVKYGPCKHFNNSVRVFYEFVQVNCYGINNSRIDVQYFAFAFKKPVKFKPDEVVYNNNGYSVLVLGIDSVSRLNFHRTMPKTLQYLKNKGAVEFMGYNKIGENTYPNVVALLLGVTISELTSVCSNRTKTFDDCPFIWNSFKRKGYVTAFAEDNGAVGTFCSRRISKKMNGFLTSPTDYYLHTYTKEAENKTFKPFKAPFEYNYYYPCKGNKYFFDVLLDYAKSLFNAVYPANLFAVFWTATMSHDVISFPAVMDASYLSLLQSLERNHYLSNTIVCIVSDHGFRMDASLKNTLEDRLPFLYILTPKSFREQYTEAFENLKLNTQRLTTAFDFHATLENLADISAISNSAIKDRSKKSIGNERGISLFLPIPKNRTCESASIAENWCGWQEGGSAFKPVLDKSEKEILKCANLTLSYMNRLVHKNVNCAHLTLKKLINAEIKLKPDMKVIRMLLQTSPGDGMFEATVLNQLDTSGLKRHNLSVSPDISRLNTYYQQSLCVHNNSLKPYCYCKNTKQHILHNIKFNIKKNG